MVNAKQDNSAAMRDLAERYSDELRAKFRTLNYFVKHAGEIGRAHEEFLAGCVRRFLPHHVGLGTGFIASSDWTSSQQDIVFYDTRRGPLLFETGSCVVVDRGCFLGSVEVKTTLSGGEPLDKTIASIARFRGLCGRAGFHGLYAWEGAELSTVVDALWGYVRSNGIASVNLLPSAIHVSGRFVLLKYYDGHLTSPVYRVLSVGPEVDEGPDVTEGVALLAFIAQAVAYGGLLPNWPFWLRGVVDIIEEKGAFIEWPEDLRDAAAASQNGA